MLDFHVDPVRPLASSYPSLWTTSPEVRLIYFWAQAMFDCSDSDEDQTTVLEYGTFVTVSNPGYVSLNERDMMGHPRTSTSCCRMIDGKLGRARYASYYSKIGFDLVVCILVQIPRQDSE